MKQTPFARLLALSVYATALAIGAPAALAQTVAPPATHPYAQSQPIPGRYIVVFWDSVSNPAAEAGNLLRASGGQLHHTYSSAIKGFAASLPDAALQGVRNNPNVNYIEQDQTVSLNEAILNPPVTQSPATWGLDRIDQRDLPLNGNYQYNYTGAASIEPSSPAVNAFIIDTGIRATHTDFQGRVLTGRNFVNGANDTNTDDCNGHGTHVSGTVAGLTWGVAKAASLIPVRVLDCRGSGTWSGVIAGIDFAVNSTLLRPAVANMSLGGGASQAVDDAVAGAVSRGVTIVVAAGNSNANACNYSPARAPSAITVGATTSTDARASYSNYGSCLDLFAPGSGITSAWNTSDIETHTISGTSMASPHVAGVAALALAANTAASPWAVADFLTRVGNATPYGAFTDGSPNLLVYSLALGAPEEPVGQTVAVKFVGKGSDVYKNGWRAWVTVSVGIPPYFTAASGEATVLGTFSPGGTARCTVTGTGNCKLTSATIKNNIPLTKFTLKGVSGILMNYDATKNEGIAPEISISK
ncbi:MAG: S8 family serine peptidase [Burkholderiales bacterium]|nr:S8 family serine peptidase [Burkholderiales bacterium]